MLLQVERREGGRHTHTRREKVSIRALAPPRHHVNTGGAPVHYYRVFVGSAACNRCGTLTAEKFEIIIQ